MKCYFCNSFKNRALKYATKFWCNRQYIFWYFLKQWKNLENSQRKFENIKVFCKDRIHTYKMQVLKVGITFFKISKTFWGNLFIFFWKWFKNSAKLFFEYLFLAFSFIFLFFISFSFSKQHIWIIFFTFLPNDLKFNFPPTFIW